MSAQPGPEAFKRRLPMMAGLALLAFLSLALIVAPLAAILYRAVVNVDQGTWRLSGQYLAEVLTRSIYWEALLNTLLVSAGAALVATSAGSVFAWIFARSDAMGRGALEWISQLPIFIPPFVGAIAWSLLAAPRSGIINRLLDGAGLPGQLDVYTRLGMLLVIGLYLAPYVMMIVAAAMRSIDPSLEEAAQVCGLTQMQTARRITVPLLAPAILSGGALAFTIAIGLFGTPIVLGWSRQILMLTSRIWISSQEVPPGYGIMAVLSIYLLLLSSLSTWLQRSMQRGRHYTTITGKGFRPRQVELGAWRWAATALAVLYVGATILGPIAVLIAAALAKYTWSGQYALANLIGYLATDDVWFTLQNSLLISVAAASIATAAGILVAWIIVRSRLRGRGILEYVVLLPISVPGIAFGVGLMLVWVNLPVAVYGTMLIIILAFVGRFTAYAVRSVSASLIQVHPELEESARVCGYGPLRTFRRITLPLILPSIVAAWLLLFSFFMTELSMVVILYTAQSRTFSVLAFEAWNVGDFSRLASYSLLQMAIGFLFMALLKTLFRRRAAPRSLQPIATN
ncbi:ABC transporter permease [Pollutimonas bauzanensis]|uniref:Iron(III) transport system permease protein n=1 Tax=Pollutimonas bauzanensis TaxID=658167 RepID=A0A1M5WC47_9BURK|nr:iron ABC transporter permease [Pollutimonas bauzanensis]SHH85169.1 iron(III) transport system permease protein [Pollutimonas bauzanensis]